MLSTFRSATVDSDLFSRYFGHCPVIAAEGRTHPVTTYFLEDIYETINYRLASDSAASLRNEASTKAMVYNNMIWNISTASWLIISLFHFAKFYGDYTSFYSSISCSSYVCYGKKSNYQLEEYKVAILLCCYGSTASTWNFFFSMIAVDCRPTNHQIYW